MRTIKNTKDEVIKLKTKKHCYSIRRGSVADLFFNAILPTLKLLTISFLAYVLIALYVVNVGCN